MDNQTPKQVPTFLDLAKTILATLEQQENKSKRAEQTNEAQKDLNANFEKRIAQLETVNEHLAARVVTLERELANVTKALAEKKTVKEQETKTDPKRNYVSDQGLEEELRRIFGKKAYVSPETLLWILGR